MRIRSEPKKKKTLPYESGWVGSGCGEGGDGFGEERIGVVVGVYKGRGGVEEGSYDDALHTRGNHMTPRHSSPESATTADTRFKSRHVIIAWG